MNCFGNVFCVFPKNFEKKMTWAVVLTICQVMFVLRKGNLHTYKKVVEINLMKATENTAHVSLISAQDPRTYMQIRMWKAVWLMT